MPSEFDFHAAIKELAEWADDSIPFVSLRILCPSCFGHCKIGGAAEPSGPFTIPAVLVYRPCVRCEAQGWVFVSDAETACWRIEDYFVASGYEVSYMIDEPEPGNVWLVIRTADGLHGWKGISESGDRKEALLRAALAQKKEHHA